MPMRPCGSGRTRRWCASPEPTWAGTPAPGASWPGNAAGCGESTRPRRLTARRVAGRFVFETENQFQNEARRHPPQACSRLRRPRTAGELDRLDRKSTRLNSSHVESSYAVFCLKKKKKKYSRLYNINKKTKQIKLITN